MLRPLLWLHKKNQNIRNKRIHIRAPSGLEVCCKTWRSFDEEYAAWEECGNHWWLCPEKPTVTHIQTMHNCLSKITKSDACTLFSRLHILHAQSIQVHGKHHVCWGQLQLSCLIQYQNNIVKRLHINFLRTNMGIPVLWMRAIQIWYMSRKHKTPPQETRLVTVSRQLDVCCIGGVTVEKRTWQWFFRSNLNPKKVLTSIWSLQIVVVSITKMLRMVSKGDFICLRIWYAHLQRSTCNFHMCGSMKHRCGMYIGTKRIWFGNI